MKNKLKKELTIRDFEKNKENPFLKEAVEQVQNNIVKKYKTNSNTDEKAILKAIDSSGEVLGHTSFVRQIKVDEEKFTKLYLTNFTKFFDLPPSAIKVFGYVMNSLIPKKDMFYVDFEECMEYTGYKSQRSIHQGLSFLLKAEIIARGSNEFKYFINPMVAFNGNRMTFAETYVKEKKGKLKEIDPNQVNFLDQIKDPE